MILYVFLFYDFYNIIHMLPIFITYAPVHHSFLNLIIPGSPRAPLFRPSFIHIICPFHLNLIISMIWRILSLCTRCLLSLHSALSLVFLRCITFSFLSFSSLPCFYGNIGLWSRVMLSLNAFYVGLTDK